MPVYHYKKSSLIDRIEVKSPLPDITHATIIARAGAGAGDLERIRMALGKHSLSTLMDTKDGRSIIQVRGLKKDAKQLFSSLDKFGLGKNAARKEETAADGKSSGFFGRVRGKALFLSAIFYDLGNVACIIAGIQHGRHNAGGKFKLNDISELMTGVTFSAGDILMTFFGENKGDEELKAAANGLKRHLHQKGIKVPEGDELNPDTLHQTGTFKAVDRWLRKHIIHIKCLTELAGGLFTIHAGLKLDDKGLRNNGKLTAGLLISTGWLATFLLDKPRGHHIFDDDMNRSSSLAEKMANNPRAWIARPLAMSNNAAFLWGALNPWTGERTRVSKAKEELREATNQLKMKGMVGFIDPSEADPKKVAALHQSFEKLQDVKRRQYDYIWNVLAACSFLVGHTLFGLSDSKRPAGTDDDKAVMNDLVLMSANVLARQPEAVRAASIGETAEYISRLAHVRLTKEQVETAIRDKVAGLAHSGWASRVQTESAPGLQL